MKKTGRLARESCVTTSITEAEVRSCFEDVRSYTEMAGTPKRCAFFRRLHSFTHLSRVQMRSRII